jgi:hypothetical protein
LLTLLYGSNKNVQPNLNVAILLPNNVLLNIMTWHFCISVIICHNMQLLTLNFMMRSIRDTKCVVLNAVFTAVGKNRLKKTRFRNITLLKSTCLMTNELVWWQMNLFDDVTIWWQMNLFDDKCDNLMTNELVWWQMWQFDDKCDNLMTNIWW